MSEPIRLQKYLSQKGVCSRREAEIYIRSGRLQVDGVVATLGDRVTSGAHILLDGKQLMIPETVEKIVLAYHKPTGLETTLATQPEVKTLADIDFGVGRVFPVGRLDKASRGLLLLTNDGDLAHRLMHPSFEKVKIYLVKLNKKITQKDKHTLASGVVIERKKTAPCQVELSEGNTIEMRLQEGRNRQIRRMCGALGYEVLDLFRVAFGPIELGELPAGDWRTLSSSEVRALAVDPVLPAEELRSR